jgi:NADPH:quinone reductase-like Zn-dependent oxidoreductase
VEAALARGLGAVPIDYQRDDFTCVLPGGFDVIFDGVGEDGFRRSFAALKPGGLLCAYGYSANVHGESRLPVLHGLQVFDKIPFLNADWEKRTVEKYLGRKL